MKWVLSFLVVLITILIIASITGCSSANTNSIQSESDIIYNVVPKNGAILEHLDITFGASVNLDKRWLDYEKIELYISDSSNNINSSIAYKENWKGHHNPSYEIVVGDINKFYYWKWKFTFYSSIYDLANDCCGESYETPVATFMVKGATISLIEPSDNEVIDVGSTLQWQSLKNANNYSVCLSHDKENLKFIVNEKLNCIEAATSLLPIAVTSSSPSEMKYYWRVLGKDSKGHVIATSLVWSFKIQLAEIMLTSPKDSSVVYDPNPTLKWNKLTTDDSSITYKVFLHEERSYVEKMDSKALLKSNIRNNSYKLEKSLDVGNTYYWRVIAENDSGAMVATSPVWSFKLEKEANINLLKFKTYPPNLIAMFVQVYMHNYPATSLNTDDFVMEDDGEKLAFLESYKGVKKSHLVDYKFKTVIAVDVSGSISYDDLEEIKKALKTIVELKAPFQEIAIIAFSQDPITIIDFTSDKEALLEAINSIDRSAVGATDLYGAVIEGVSKWKDSFKINKVVMGMLIVLTDGVDTAKKHSLEEVLYSRGNKRVYTVGVGTEVDENVLRKIGNEGYISIESFDQLVNTIKKIQSYMMDYVSSFYLIYYLSPRRKGWHNIKLNVARTEISEKYNADDFSNPNVDIKALSISTDTTSATLALKTYVNINSEEIEDFSFINPVYKPYGDYPSKLRYVFDKPNLGDYDLATLTLLFPETGFSGSISILDERYQVKKEFFLDLK